MKAGFHMIATIAMIAELFFSDCSDHSDRSDHIETSLNSKGIYNTRQKSRDPAKMLEPSNRV